MAKVKKSGGCAAGTIIGNGKLEKPAQEIGNGKVKKSGIEIGSGKPKETKRKKKPKGKKR